MSSHAQRENLTNNNPTNRSPRRSKETNIKPNERNARPSSFLMRFPVILENTVDSCYDDETYHHSYSAAYEEWTTADLVD